MARKIRPGLCFLGLLLSLSTTAAVAAGRAGDPPSREEYRRPDSIPAPSSNPLTAEKAELGKTLFFDARLSRDGNMSCASCHSPDKRWSDGRLRPIGSENVPNARRTPTVLNSAWLTVLMWDGRASTLEAQAVLPITTPHEMNFDMPTLVKRLAEIKGYRPLFARAYGDETVNPKRITEALASFQRTIVSRPAPFDRWVAGDESAMSARAKRGFELFGGKANCAACHKSWRFTDDSFHDIGLNSSDLGRGARVPAQVTSMQHAFKTPSLRDLPINGPYMHDGSMSSLEEVIKHYEKGGLGRKSRSADIKPFELTDEERLSLVEFIQALDGGPVSVNVPPMPE
jgi:cytochrome c peroxidase